MRQLLVALCLALGACTSTAPAIHHYTLGSGSSEAVSANPADGPLVLVQAPQLADYLRQSYLVMRTGEHELAFAQRHVWSESLRSAIPGLVAEALNARDSDRVYITGDDPRADERQMSLRLRIREFLPTHQSQVRLRADYWLLDGEGETQLSRSVDLSQPLEKDGYAQAVAQMNALLLRLAEAIGDSTNELEQP